MPATASIAPISENAVPRRTPAAGTAVFLTHSSFTSAFRVGSHQLAKAFDSRGWRVLHIPTPITPAHFPLAMLRADYRKRIGVWWRSSTRIFRQTQEYQPLALLPWQLVRRTASATDWYARAQWAGARFVQRSGFTQPDLLFIDEPRLTAMARWFRPKRCLYRSTDLYHEMHNDPSLIAAEREALRHCDGFVATSQPVFDHLRALAPLKPGLVVQNGVELDHFTQPGELPPEFRAIPAPRAVYIGAMDTRFDFEAVVHLAKARPFWSFVLIGPPPDIETGTLPRNLHLLGPRTYEELPAYLHHSTVGLLPLTPQPANHGRSPMKIYEYGAAGLPVLASRTDELARRSLPFVTLCQRPNDMPAALDALLRDHAAFAHAARTSSRSMSWQTRLDEILRFAAGLSAND